MKPKNLIELKEQRPQLYKRLVNWGLQRRKDTWTRDTLEYITKTTIESEIETYLDQLVFTPTKFSQAKENLIYWGSKLTDKEKQAVGLLIPYSLPLVKERINKKLKNINTNWYDGLYKVLDEPVLDKLTYNSEEIGLITENSYDAVILNTDNMLIIDIDINGEKTFDEVALSCQRDSCKAKYPEQAISALHILEEKENLNFRIYQTAGGLRAIETTKEWRPASWGTKKLMRSVYADPLYIGLCWSQECFRARLTPKPWRHSELAPRDYNYESGQEWINSEYTEEVAVCKLLKGNPTKLDSKFKSAIEYHDRITKALESTTKDLILV